MRPSFQFTSVARVCPPFRSLSTTYPVIRSAFRSPFAMHHTIFVYHISNHRLLPLPRVSSAFRSPFAMYPAIRFVSHEASGCGCHIPWHAWATSCIVRAIYVDLNTVPVQWIRHQWNEYGGQGISSVGSNELSQRHKHTLIRGVRRAELISVAMSSG